MNPCVRVGVGVIVYNSKNELLIGMRNSAHGRGMWGLPGGHLEMGETPEECAHRETMEEAGISIQNLHPIGYTNDIFSSEKQYITLFIESEHANGSVKVLEPDKMSHWEWRSWDNLPQPLFLGLVNLINSPFSTHLRTSLAQGSVAA